MSQIVSPAWEICLAPEAKPTSSMLRIRVRVCERNNTSPLAARPVSFVKQNVHSRASSCSLIGGCTLR